MKEKALFAAEVLIVVAVCALFQQNVMNLPLIGQYLPGFKPTTAS